VLEENERERITVMFKTCDFNLEDCTCKDEKKVISKNNIVGILKDMQLYGVEIKKLKKEIILEED
jgi:hypothetical protein